MENFQGFAPVVFDRRVSVLRVLYSSLQWFPLHEGLPLHSSIEGKYVRYSRNLLRSDSVPEPELGNPWFEHVQAIPAPIALRRQKMNSTIDGSELR